MNQNREKTYKHQNELIVFFNGSDIRVHNLDEYFAERGIILFSRNRRPVAKFASNFIYGVDSQEKLKKYIGVKAFPAISGFILESKDDVSMEKLKEYFNAHVGKVFEDIKKSTFIHLGVEINKLIGEIEYITTVSTGNSLFEILTRNIRFEIIKKKNTYIVSMLLEQENDYNIVYGVINTILSEDKHINFNIIEQNLSVLGNTGKIHTFFKESITEINSIYEFIGIINFSRKKADDGSTKDPFEMNLLDGNLETKLTNIEPLIKSLENRSARLSGAGVVLHDRKLDYIFMVKMVSNDQKKRLEIGLSEIKKVQDEQMLQLFSKKDDFYNFESANLSNEEKMSIMQGLWELVSIKFYELKNRTITS